VYNKEQLAGLTHSVQYTEIHNRTQLVLFSTAVRPLIRTLVDQYERDAFR